MSSSEDANGLTPSPDAPHAFSNFAVEHLVPPAPPRTLAQRLTDPTEFALALLFNLLLVFALFYTPKPKLQEVKKDPPSISVDLVPKPQAQPRPKPQQQQQQQKQQPQPKPKAEEKPKQEEKKPQQKPKDMYRESGGDPKLKPGRAPKVDADKTKVAPEKKAEKPTPDAPKKPESDLPAWAKSLSPGYDLPKAQKSSVDKSRGSNTQDSLSDREGEGGGDVYLNALVAQVGAHVTYPLTGGGAVGVVFLNVLVNSDGSVEALKLIRSSGRQDLDTAALTAIRDSLPFRPLPSDYPAPVSIMLKIPVAPDRPGQ